VSLALGGLATIPLLTSAHADTPITVHAPCTDGTKTAAGLRSCSAFIAPLVKQISNPGTSYPPSTQSSPGMLQTYSSCYYQGVDVDPLLSTATTCGGNKFGTVCALVPSTLSNNQTESAGKQSSLNNSQALSCGTEMKITVTSAACANTTSEEDALLKNLGTSASQIDGLNADEAQALFNKAVAINPDIATSPAGSGKQLCISLDSSGLDSQNGVGSLERTYLRGTYVQALSYYTDQVLNQLKCQHTITVPSTSCQSFASKVNVLTGTTQQNMSSLQSMLQSQQNLGDIDACNTQSFNPVPTSGGLDPGVLRQSAQHLCSARANLESAFSELVMCDIIAQAQASYFVNTGSPVAQLNVLNTMNTNLDKVCRPQCKDPHPKSLAGLASCLQTCYHTQMPLYLTNLFQTLWPQPTPASSVSCVAGGTNAQ
jgi:hypothetical protein